MADKYRRFARSGSSRCGTATAAWVGAVVSASLPQAARERPRARARLTLMSFRFIENSSFFSFVPYAFIVLFKARQAGQDLNP